MPGEEAGPDAAVMKEATKAVAGSGTVKFDIPHRVRAVYGRQLGIAGANGGYSYVALFYRNNRLYQVEGDALVAGGRRKLTRCASSSRSISPKQTGAACRGTMSAPGESRHTIAEG